VGFVIGIITSTNNSGLPESILRSVDHILLSSTHKICSYILCLDQGAVDARWGAGLKAFDKAGAFLNDSGYLSHH
jgi:hypothetical protein